MNESYKQALADHQWALDHGHIARIRNDGEYFWCEVAMPSRGWINFR